MREHLRVVADVRLLQWQPETGDDMNVARAARRHAADDVDRGVNEDPQIAVGSRLRFDKNRRA